MAAAVTGMAVIWVVGAGHRLPELVCVVAALGLFLVQTQPQPGAAVRRVAGSAALVGGASLVLGWPPVRGTTGGSPKLAVLALLEGLLHYGYLILVVLLLVLIWPVAQGADGTTPAAARPRVERVGSIVLVVAVLAQLLLGLVQIRFPRLLWVHMGVGATLVMPLVAHIGVRTWLASEDSPGMRRVGVALVVTIVLQVALGMIAWSVPGSIQMGSMTGQLDLAVAKLHAWVGSILLALGVVVAARCLGVPRTPTSGR